MLDKLHHWRIETVIDTKKGMLIILETKRSLL